MVRRFCGSSWRAWRRRWCAASAWTPTSRWPSARAATRWLAWPAPSAAASAPSAAPPSPTPRCSPAHSHLNHEWAHLITHHFCLWVLTCHQSVGSSGFWIETSCLWALISRNIINETKKRKSIPSLALFYWDWCNQIICTPSSLQWLIQSRWAEVKWISKWILNWMTRADDLSTAGRLRSQTESVSCQLSTSSTTWCVCSFYWTSSCFDIVRSVNVHSTSKIWNLLPTHPDRMKVVLFSLVFHSFP